MHYSNLSQELNKQIRAAKGLVDSWLEAVPFSGEVDEEDKRSFLDTKGTYAADFFKGRELYLRQVSRDNLKLERLFLEHESIEVALVMATVTENSEVLRNLANYLTEGRYDVEKSTPTGKAKLTSLCETLLISEELPSEFKQRVLGHCISHYPHDIRRDLAQSDRVPYIVIDTLSKDPNWLVRARVAANPLTSEKTLRELEGDDSEVVLSNICQNPNSSPETKSRLAKGTPINVRRTICEKELIPFDQIEGIKTYCNGRWFLRHTEKELNDLKVAYPERTYRFYGETPMLQLWVSETIVNKLGLSVENADECQTFAGERIFKFCKEDMASLAIDFPEYEYVSYGYAGKP